MDQHQEMWSQEFRTTHDSHITNNAGFTYLSSMHFVKTNVCSGTHSEYFVRNIYKKRRMIFSIQRQKRAESKLSTSFCSIYFIITSTKETLGRKEIHFLQLLKWSRMELQPTIVAIYHKHKKWWFWNGTTTPDLVFFFFFSNAQSAVKLIHWIIFLKTHLIPLFAVFG